ncbi:MAG: hypothetical protein PHN19_05085 [Patescibacteria group bacterium]|nr:hypothetical protein [Patescibacteria group bacterium]
MPHRFPAMERKTFGCTDFSDHKRSLLIALQVWDISDRCPKVDHRALLIFARKRSGMMFLLRDCNKSNYQTGTELYYELNDEIEFQREFIAFCLRWGIEPHDLSHLIYELVPK